MTGQDLIELSERYFKAFDTRDMATIETVLTDDCTLVIETHGIRHEGRDAICALLRARWETPMQVRHHDFIHTPAPDQDRIACQFKVTYKGDGAPPQKSNANVFTVRDGRFSSIQVYMSGENTIRT